MKRIAIVLLAVAGTAFADDPPAPFPTEIPPATETPPVTEPPPATVPAPDPPANGALVLAADLGGRFEILRLIGTGAKMFGVFDKFEGTTSRYAVPEGDYRIVRSGPGVDGIQVVEIHVDAGAEAMVARAHFPVDDAPPANSPPSFHYKPAYPLGLAARPLTLPAHMLDLTLAYFGNFTASDYSNDLSHLLASNYAITDRFSIRDLGVYYALLPKNGAIPEFAVGGGLSGINYDGINGLQLTFAAYADAKQHFGERAAIALRGIYTLTVQTSNTLPLGHEVAAGIDLLFDLATRVSLIVSGDYDFQRSRATLGVDHSPTFDAQRITPSLAIHVAPVNWLDLRTGIGPSWYWADGVPATLGGRWQVSARFRW